MAAITADTILRDGQSGTLPDGRTVTAPPGKTWAAYYIMQRAADYPSEFGRFVTPAGQAAPIVAPAPKTFDPYGATGGTVNNQTVFTVGGYTFRNINGNPQPTQNVATASLGYQAALAEAWRMTAGEAKAAATQVARDVEAAGFRAAAPVAAPVQLVPAPATSSTTAATVVATGPAVTAPALPAASPGIAAIVGAGGVMPAPQPLAGVASPAAAPSARCVSRRCPGKGLTIGSGSQALSDPLQAPANPLGSAAAPVEPVASAAPAWLVPALVVAGVFLLLKG